MFWSLICGLHQQSVHGFVSVVVRALELCLKRSRVRISAVSTPSNNLGQVVHTHVPLSPSSIIWYRGQRAVMLCGWGGNRRSGVALAMRHRFQWFIHMQPHRLRKGDEHPAYIPHAVWHSHTLLLASVLMRVALQFSDQNVDVRNLFLVALE